MLTTALTIAPLWLATDEERRKRMPIICPRSLDARHVTLFQEQGISNFLGSLKLPLRGYFNKNVALRSL